MTGSDVAEWMCVLLGSVLPRHSAIYIAGPLGHSKERYDESSPGSVRDSNEAKLTQFAETLRQRQSMPVIDPGPLKVPVWSDKDTGEFFLRIIELFACEAWFLDGWEFSHGATKEFIRCVDLGIPCKTESGESLKLNEAIRLIERESPR